MTINVRVYSQVLTKFGLVESVLPSDFQKPVNTLFISPDFIANNKTNIDCICLVYANLLPEENVAYCPRTSGNTLFSSGNIFAYSQQMQSIFV